VKFFNPDSEEPFFNENSFKSEKDLEVRQGVEERGVEELLEEANKSEELTNTNTLNQAVDGLESGTMVEDEPAIDTENLLDLVDQSGKKNPHEDSEGENALIDELDQNMTNEDLEDGEPDFSEELDLNDDQENDHGPNDDKSEAEKFDLNAGNLFCKIAAHTDDISICTLNRQMAIQSLKKRESKLQDLIQSIRPEKQKFATRYKSSLEAGEKPKFEPKDQATEIIIGKLSELESLEIFSTTEDDLVKYELIVPFLKIAILFFSPENREIFSQTDNSVVFQKAK